MYSEKIEALIKAALADGVLTEKEKQVLFKNAQAQGIDLDEFEMVLDAKLVELQKAEKEKAAKSAPKSNKFGDVRKCPACGALVPALGVICAECGYEFSGVESSSSAQLLAKKIEEIKRNASEKKNKILQEKKYSTTKGKMEIFSPLEEALDNIDEDAENQINSFVSSMAVPNAKNDLFDLILYLKPNIGEKVYRDKFQECVDRAKYLFPSDPLLLQVVNECNANMAKLAAKTIRATMLFIGACIGLCVGGVLEPRLNLEEGLAWTIGLFGGICVFAAIGELVVYLKNKINR